MQFKQILICCPAGLSHEKNIHKMRVLTFMSIGETTSEISFDELCKELNIGIDEVEEFIIEGGFDWFKEALSWKFLSAF